MPPPRPKVPPYLLMLVVSFALVGLIGYQTLKDRKFTGDLLVENQTLKELLKKERKKASDLNEKFTKLSSQKEELNGVREGLNGQLIELKRVKSLADEGKRKLELSFAEKENEVKDLKEKVLLLDEKEEELKRMKKEIMQKDAEISGLKAQIEVVGKHSSGEIAAESTNTSGSAVKDNEENHAKEIEEQSTPFGKGIAEKEKEADEETEDAKPEATTDGHTEEEAEMSKKKSHAQNSDLEDEESKVDDREETEDVGEEVDADKTHDEDETDEQQPDVDMEIVNKADLDENEMAAME